MESKIAYLNAELVVVAEREKKREEKERKREEEIATAKEVENKRYAALQAQLTFLFESGNILPPCLASSDENDKLIRKMRVMRMVRLIRRVRVIRSSCIYLTF
ncbi:hypothetical protein KY284_016570 [Solanum tuberosum]|nr:hypothetical protein KY284_016570 [Solanum tuberosum]